jgi:hypothetical protein
MAFGLDPETIILVKNLIHLPRKKVGSYEGSFH